MPGTRISCSWPLFPVPYAFYSRPGARNDKCSLNNSGLMNSKGLMNGNGLMNNNGLMNSNGLMKKVAQLRSSTHPGDIFAYVLGVNVFSVLFCLL